MEQTKAFQKKRRDPTWDNYKALLIFLVVIGHYLYAYAGKNPDSLAFDIVSLIYCFHMPAFVFASGFFSKSDSVSRVPACLKLIICFVVFNTAMMFYRYFAFGDSMHLLSPYYSYWYLLSLVAWRLMIRPLQGVGENRVLILATAIALLAGFWSELGTNVLSIRRTIAFFPFFYAGYIFKKDTAMNMLAWRKRYKIVLVPALICLAAVLYAMHIGISEYGITVGFTLAAPYNETIGLPHRVFLFSSAAVVSILLLLVMPQVRIPLVTTIGKNTLLIYLAHRFFTFFFLTPFPVAGYCQDYLIYALIASLITCVVLGNDWINKYFNQGLNALATTLLSTERRGRVARTVALCVIALVLASIMVLPQG